MSLCSENSISPIRGNKAKSQPRGNIRCL